jgi:cadmium resistance protein CadD (predicted permease)
LALLGIIPILLGVRKFLALRHPAREKTVSTQGRIGAIALVTIANGGDNVGVYMPAFAVHAAGQIAIIALVFAVMTALWCLLAQRLVSHPKLGAPIRHYAHFLSPLVLVGLGLFILLRR